MHAQLNKCKHIVIDVCPLACLVVLLYLFCLASVVDEVLRTPSSAERAAANDWRLAPPNAASAVVMTTYSSPDLKGIDQRFEIDGPGHLRLLRQSLMLIRWQVLLPHCEVSSLLVDAQLQSQLVPLQ